MRNICVIIIIIALDTVWTYCEAVFEMEILQTLKRERKKKMMLECILHGARNGTLWTCRTWTFPHQVTQREGNNKLQWKQQQTHDRGCGTVDVAIKHVFLCWEFRTIQQSLRYAWSRWVGPKVALHALPGACPTDSTALLSFLFPTKCCVPLSRASGIDLLFDELCFILLCPLWLT